MTEQALYAVTHHYEVLYQRETASTELGKGPWHDGTLQHHLMNGKMLVLDAAGEVIAEDFKFVQASHKVWDQGKTMLLSEDVSVEIQNFVRASRTDVAPLVQASKRDASRDEKTVHHPSKDDLDQLRPSKFGRFEFPQGEVELVTGQSMGSTSKPANMGRFVGLSEEQKQMLEDERIRDKA
ncbi:hypothetical protein OC861_000059 [Tilletia horrida]|nr:hypothetical protein OC861_000059 [Tilletia horrida]